MRDKRRGCAFGSTESHEISGKCAPSAHAPSVGRSKLSNEVTEGGKVARLTGLEPATPGVTGRYSNQLSYNRALWGQIVRSAPGGQAENPTARAENPRRSALPFADPRKPAISLEKGPEKQKPPPKRGLF